MDISHLPAINAGLNASSAALLILGYLFVRQRALTGHVIAMLGACLTSTFFLISYLTYHFHHGSTPFLGRGGIRFFYFSILISHTVLAMTIVPLAIVTVLRGLRGDFHRHVKIARLTLPLWLYVSVTGVLIYWMLYHLYA